MELCVLFKPSGPVIPNNAVELAGSPASVMLSEPISRISVAETLCAELMVTVQLLVPLQPPPLQPVNIDPAVALAVNVTLLLMEKLAMQVAPQLMPAGLLVTVPTPVPALDTISVCGPDALNVAVTLWAALRVSVQITSALQERKLKPRPVQPENVDPTAGVAVSVTTLPVVKSATQYFPQLIPTGLLSTVPAPVPALVTVSI